jgi:hypothetical protein
MQVSGSSISIAFLSFSPPPLIIVFSLLNPFHRMFNSVLGVKNSCDEARTSLSDCVAEMNTIYITLKKTKRLEKSLNPDSPATQVGDFLVSRNPWVQKARG